MEELLSACSKELSRASLQANEDYINNKEEVVENLDSTYPLPSFTKHQQYHQNVTIQNKTLHATYYRAKNYREKKYNN
jgi:hypothetical protein